MEGRGSGAHGDTGQHPHDALLTQGTEPRGASVAPASLVAAEGFDGGLCSGPIHFSIKEREKRLIFQLLLPPSEAIFFPPSFSPSPLFVAHKQPPSVELSLRFWPLSSLCPGLLRHLFWSTTALPRAGRSPLSLRVWRCRGSTRLLVKGSPSPPSACHCPEISRIPPRINWGSILSRAGQGLERLCALSHCPEGRFLTYFH